METIRNVAPDAVYRGSHAVDPGAQYFAQGQPTGGSNVGANLGFNVDLGAMGEYPCTTPSPIPSYGAKCRKSFPRSWEWGKWVLS